MNPAIRKNPVFWLMLALPGAAVLASFATLAIAMQGADRALPAIYHWEGESLEADFARARAAARLGLEAELRIADGACRLTLRGADSPELRLSLTSGTDTRLDRVVALAAGADGAYHAACQPLASGKWRVALQDAAGAWSLRTELDADSDRIVLNARAPEGPGA
jgi:hypothetical protein